MKRNKQIGWASVLFFLAFVALAASSLPAEAVSTYWQADPATPASWHDPLNWTVRVPIETDSAHVDNGGTATIWADFVSRYIYDGSLTVGHIEQNDGVGTVSECLYVGNMSNSVGTYNLSGGHLFANREVIGRLGAGHFSQSGGTNEAGYLTVNEMSSYMLSSGTLSISNSIDIRGFLDFADGGGLLEVNAGLANFSQAVITRTGSASFSSGVDTLTVFAAGFDPASFGSYNVSGLVHIAGSGPLVISGGEGFSGRGDLEITDSVDNMGTVTAKGGELVLRFSGDISIHGTGKIYSPENETLNIYLDNGAAGTLEDDGIIEATNFYLGYTTDTSSTFTQNGGESTISGGVASRLYLGFNSGSIGTYNLNGGINNVSSLYLGYDTGSTGIYNLNGGQLSAAYQSIGVQGAGIFTQIGGTNTAGEIDVRGGPGSAGIYNLDDGLLSAANELIEGTFSQTGGANTVSATLLIGYTSSATGTYNLNDGQLSAVKEYIGGADSPWSEGATGFFAQTNGTNTVSSTLYVGNSYGSTGTYNLSGGHLSSANEHIGEYGTGAFTQEGGVNTCQYLRVGPIAYDSNESVYTFHAGQLNAKDIYVTPYGYFENSGGPGVREILVTHSFLNESTYNEQFRLLNTTLILLGDGPGKPTTLDTNSLDMGLGLGGYYNNFALGNLIFEGSTVTSYYYKLFSDVYTLGLVIEDGAMVDLNGYNIYYIPMGGTIHQPPYYEPLSPSTFYLGGTWINGEILPAVTIPEPATMTLIVPAILGIAGLAAARRRMLNW